MNKPNTNQPEKVFSVHLTNEEFATLRAIMTQVPSCVRHDKHAQLYAAILYDTEYRRMTGRQWNEEKGGPRHEQI